MVSVTDNVAPDADPTAGLINIENVVPGSYTVCETAAPTGYIRDTHCQTLTVAAGQNASFGPWVNTLSAIAWLKLDDETGLKLPGATFEVVGILGTVFGPITVVDKTNPNNGTNDADPDAGEFLVGGLKLGSYRITEITPPAGYMLPTPAFQVVTLDGDPVTGSPEFPFRDPPMPVLVVVKSPDNATPTAGDAVTFKIVTTNNGPGTATSATLFDDLPEVAGDWAVVPNDDPAAAGWVTCTVSSAPVNVDTDAELENVGQWLGCAAENIGQGGTRTVTVGVTLQAGDCANLPNLATADATNTAPAFDNGSIDPRCPDIEVVKTPDAGVVDAPGTATFSIVTTNEGDGEARNSKLFDNLPEVANGWDIVANPGDAAPWDSCTIFDTDHPELGDIGEWLSCGPETILAGQAKTRTVTVSTTVTTDDCGDLLNLAKVTTSNNGTDEDAGAIHVKCPDLDITKTADDATVNAGEDIGFSITVSNSNAAGTGVADNVVLNDNPLPGSLALGVDWTIDAVIFNGGEPIEDQTLCVINGSPATETLVCNFGDLNPGDDYEVQLSSDTSAPTGCNNATLPNTAKVKADNHAEIPASASITVQCPDLDITKTADDATVNAGEDIGFSITVSNSNAAGTGVADNVVLNDNPLPGSLALGVDWTIDAVIFNGGEPIEDQTLCVINGSPATETLVCNFGDLNPGDDYEVQLSSDTSAPTGCNNATLPNTAKVKADNHAEIPASASITVQCPDLDITKTADDATVNAGEDIGFSITVSNSNAAGTGVADNVVLNDNPLPGSLALGVDWTIDAVIFNGGEPIEDQTLCVINGSPATETLVCNFGDLNPGDDYEVQLSSDTSAPTGCNNATLPNTAKVKADNHAEIPASASITVQCPDLDITKTTSTPEINAGAQASYTITIENDGDGDAVGVDLRDQLPAGVTWSTTNEACTITDGLLECLDLTIPAEGDPFTVTVTGFTDEGECPSILNRATFTSENAGSGASAFEGQGTPITVNCPDLEVEKEWVDEFGVKTETPVTAGEKAYFAIKVTNTGLGTAFDVDVLDFAPDGTTWTVEDDGGFDCPAMIDDAGDTCTAEEMAPSPPSATILLSYLTGPEDCGTLQNDVEVSASNEPANKVDVKNADSATAVVACPFLNIVKIADEDPIDAGDEASFTITIWNDGPGDAREVFFHDDLPAGIEWNMEILSGHKFGCEFASSQVEGSEFQQSIGCLIGDLEPSEMEDGVEIRVWAMTDRTDCGTLLNEATVNASNLSQELELLGH